MLPARRVDIEDAQCAPKYLRLKGVCRLGLALGGQRQLLLCRCRERAWHDREGLGNVGSVAQEEREYCHQQ